MIFALYSEWWKTKFYHHGQIFGSKNLTGRKLKAENMKTALEDFLTESAAYL